MMADRRGVSESGVEGAFEAYQADVLAYARRRVAADLADDAVAETFAIAWRRRDEMPEPPLLWLYGIARGVVSNQRRSEKRRTRLVDRLALEPAPVADDPAGLVSDRIGLAQAFDALDEDDQELLMLVAWEGLGPRQGARVLGCSAGAFRVRVHRARRNLERMLTRAQTEPMNGSSAGSVHAVGEEL